MTNKAPKKSKHLFILEKDFIHYTETYLYQRKLQIIQDKILNFKNLTQSLVKLNLNKKITLCIPPSISSCKLLPIDEELTPKEIHQYIVEAAASLFGKAYEELYIDYQMIPYPLSCIPKKSGQLYLQIIAAKKASLTMVIQAFNTAKTSIKTIETSSFVFARLACHLFPKQMGTFSGILIHQKTFLFCVIEKGCLIYAKQGIFEIKETSGELKQTLQIFKTLYPHALIQHYFIINETNSQFELNIGSPYENVSIEESALLLGLNL